VPETGQTAGSEAEKKFGVDAAINLFEKLGAISFEKIFDVVFVDVLIVVVVV
jgi:predicted HTH domain antitoxin